jgi:ribosome-associated translation inhibitor RaiA
MRVRFTVKLKDASKRLVEVMESKLGNLSRKFRPHPDHINITLDQDGPFKKMRATLITTDGRDIEAIVRGQSEFSMIDDLIQKLARQMSRVKDRKALGKPRGQGRAKRDFDLAQLSSARQGFWAQTPIDAGDILKLSPAHRGPLPDEPAKVG